MPSAPEKEYLEIQLKSLHLRFNHLSPILEEELEIMNQIVKRYIKHQTDLK